MCCPPSFWAVLTGSWPVLADFEMNAASAHMPPSRLPSRLQSLPKELVPG
ncbi:hypothetical protein COCNU_10G000230 [Cocos nucifera]|uniref:Uncharacterized protein n=1 Tax=Cocos nucifera TaxID=13894 RepID=A0A8K0ILG1_COCNU|nr:hypothetical protein COCNU_10G000230 [Cocos nucifera]